MRRRHIYLQLALDVFPLDEALRLAAAVQESVDIFEIGTPFLLDVGLEAVRAFRKRFPHASILADAKIADAGAYETRRCLEAGADYVTVLGMCDLGTISESVDVANELGGVVVADMICVPDLGKRVAELRDAGVTAFAVHTGIDQQRAGRTPLADLKEIRQYASGRDTILVAGGISQDTVDEYCDAGADIVICGGAIASAADPAKMAAAIAVKVHEENPREI